MTPRALAIDALGNVEEASGASQANGLGSAEAPEPHAGLGPTGAIPSARFTPGPWQSKSDYTKGDACTIIANVDGDTDASGSTTYSYDFICTCEDEYGEFTERAEYNANLIVASPNLYAALQKIATLRPAGDVDAATGTRALVKQMERIAIDALARVRA